MGPSCSQLVPSPVWEPDSLLELSASSHVLSSRAFLSPMRFNSQARHRQNGQSRVCRTHPTRKAQPGPLGGEERVPPVVDHVLCSPDSPLGPKDSFPHLPGLLQQMARSCLPLRESSLSQPPRIPYWVTPENDPGITPFQVTSVPHCTESMRCPYQTIFSSLSLFKWLHCWPYEDRQDGAFRKNVLQMIETKYEFMQAHSPTGW